MLLVWMLSFLMLSLWMITMVSYFMDILSKCLLLNALDFIIFTLVHILPIVMHNLFLHAFIIILCLIL